MTEHRKDIDLGLLTHVGMVREENQDWYAFYEPAEEEELCRKGRVLVVCDGMGGHNGGLVASHVAVEKFLEAVVEEGASDPDGILSRSMNWANRAVREQGSRDPKLYNMGTTCVALLVRGSELWTAHVGDSRAYLFRDGEVQQITHDHTYLNDLIDMGLLTPEQARNHPERNIITRCVGMADELQVEMNRLLAKPGDIFLLCSDGLYNHVEDEEMREAVLTLDAQPACQALVDLANERGGEDNITVAILRILQIPDDFKWHQKSTCDREPEIPSTTVESAEADPKPEDETDSLRGTFQDSAGAGVHGSGQDKGKPRHRWRLLGAFILLEALILAALELLIHRY